MARQSNRFGCGALALAAVLLSSGCAYRVAYNPSYVTTGVAPARVPGQALLYMDGAAQAYVFKGHPSSLTASATTLEIPLGQIDREVGLAAFNSLFTGGCVPTDARAEVARGGYAAVIEPRLIQFDYRYNQLKNLGFAITPQVNVTMQFNLLDQAGGAWFTRTYGSGWYDGTSYMVSMRPHEMVNRVAHEVTCKIFKQAAGDIETALRSQPAAAPAAAPAAPAEAVPAKPLPPSGAPRVVDPARPDNSPAAAADRLKKLKELYDQGLISEETYQQKQKEILDGL